MVTWYPAFDCIHVPLGCNLFEVRNCVSGLLLSAVPNTLPGAYYASVHVCWTMHKIIVYRHCSTYNKMKKWRNTWLLQKLMCGADLIFPLSGLFLEINFFNPFLEDAQLLCEYIVPSQRAIGWQRTYDGCQSPLKNSDYKYMFFTLFIL